MEECFEKLNAHGGDEPWQVFLPLINLPDSVNFSSDEMGMLLGLKDDNTFNATMELDVLHNSLIDAMKVLNADRRALTTRLQPQTSEGNKLSGTFSEKDWLTIRPAMIEVNSLAEAVRNQATRDNKQSREALEEVLALFRRKLEIKQKLEFPQDEKGA